MVFAILKPKQLDIVPFVLCIGNLMDFIRVTTTSHSVQDQYSGSGLIPVENDGLLKDYEDTPLQCVISGSTDVDIVWKWRNARTLNTDHYFTWDTTHINVGGISFSTSTISFNKDLPEADRREASGVIYAEGAHADDPGVKTTCNDVSLTFTWKPDGTPSLSINKDPLVFGEDSTAQLSCELTDKGNPEGQVRWIKNGNLQSESEYSTQMISIPVTKDIDNDKWQCYYYNTAGNGNYSDEVMINVHWKPLKPALSINKETFVIGEDSIAQLTCQLTDKGNPEGQVRWIKNGNLQSESEYSTQMISIPVTKDIDGDKWQCYYYNTAGDGDYSDQVMIDVHCSPGGATISADTQTPTRDDTFTFTCTGDRGNPPGRVLWYLSGTMVANTINKQYTVTGAKESHNGNWSCIFNNYLKSGAQSQSIQIQVQHKPSKPELVLDADSNNIRFGDNFTIQCVSQHGANTIWLKNNDVQAGPSFTANNITIIHADASVIGVWSCYVSNEVGKSIVSNAVEISVKYLPGVDIDYITYEFTSESISFTLKITDLFAASNLEVSVCSVGNYPSCTMEQQLDIKHSRTIEQIVVLPVSSDDAVYNVTFTFSDDYRIVTRHGMAIKGPFVQSQIPTILAVLFGTLLIVAIVTIVALVYVFHWRNKATGIPVPRENSVQYVNVGPDGNAGDITHIQAASEYEDVNTAATTNGQSSNIGNATYMDLDQNDIQQTRNRPTEVTVYQSLN